MSKVKKSINCLELTEKNCKKELISATHERTGKNKLKMGSFAGCGNKRVLQAPSEAKTLFEALPKQCESVSEALKGLSSTLQLKKLINSFEKRTEWATEAQKASQKL